MATKYEIKRIKSFRKELIKSRLEHIFYLGEYMVWLSGTENGKLPDKTVQDTIATIERINDLINDANERIAQLQADEMTERYERKAKPMPEVKAITRERARTVQEEQKMFACGRCSREIGSDAKYCPSCGATLLD